MPGSSVCSEVSVPAVTGRCWPKGGRHHPAVGAVLAQIALEPVTTCPRFVDKDQLFGLGVYVSDALVNATVAGGDRAEVDDLGVVVLGHVGHGHRLWMYIHAAIKHANLCHG
jgi:hypothetical protein